ncbi:MAG: DUF128 domain-containing protein [Phycisphaeraceae bacterium]|nr:DUF128 domain-containing protein [Phycisphaeraceae bacterium]
MTTPKTQRNRLLILTALRRSTGPMTGSQLAQVLSESGHPLSERAVRLYLNAFDQEGLTAARGKRGRMLTEKGLAELRNAQTFERVGYLSAKIDQLTYGMSFDLSECSGRVVVNTSLVKPKTFAKSLDKVCQVFARGYAMGQLVGVLAPGQTLGECTVPADEVGFCTVCSITLNGVLLKHGVPTASRFGGLIQLRDGKPTRFVEMIHYNGTSIDPLEVFIRSGMTDYHGAIRDGNGLIGASYRELPENCRDLVVHLAERLANVGLGGFMQIGVPGQNVLEVPVSEGCIGAVVIGGLNPIAIMEEAGHRVQSRALAGWMEYERLFRFEQLPAAIKAYM